MGSIIGRTAEISHLQEWVNGDRSEFIAIYGLAPGMYADLFKQVVTLDDLFC